MSIAKGNRKMKKLNIIFDTDIGSDCDDVMALTYLVYAQRYLGAEVKAVTYSNHFIPQGPAAIRSFFRNLGEKIPPIGLPAAPIAIGGDSYCKQIVEKFGCEEDMTAPFEESIHLMRRILAESEDGSSVICAVGAFTNVAALLRSTPDEISPFDGVELVRQKCSKAVLMAGIFDKNDDRTEWNVHLDIDATREVAKLCPVPLTFLPSETGMNMMTGGPAVKKYGENTPLSLSFLLYPPTKKDNYLRHSWDPATALYAVEGCREFFEETEGGVIKVNGEGRTSFTPTADGKHRVLYVNTKDGKTEAEAKAAVAKYLDDCAIKVYERN